MKTILLFLTLSLGALSQSLAETNVYVEKTCTQTVEVNAVCAGYADDHPVDPIFEPEFVYLSQESFKKVTDLGLNPRAIKDAFEVCDELDGYPIYMLFGENALPPQEIDFETIEVEFIKDCE
jgi:hypothetical protein